jgi:hypothetical protein
VGKAAAIAFTGPSRAELCRLMGQGKVQFVKYKKRRLLLKKSLMELLANLVPEKN